MLVATWFAVFYALYQLTIIAHCIQNIMGHVVHKSLQIRRPSITLNKALCQSCGTTVSLFDMCGTPDGNMCQDCYEEYVTDKQNAKF